MKKSVGMTLLTFLFIAPGSAQQTDADAGSLVPENVAAHPAPTQPLPYSHKTHMALGLVCQTCHTNPDPGVLMTYPATAMCMSCHLSVETSKTAIADLHAFAASGQEIPWVRVYAVTPGITWNHRAHLVSGTQCETCHGDVSQMEAVSESTAILAMASCISCHEARGAEIECVACHAWPTDQFLGIK